MEWRELIVGLCFAHSSHILYQEYLYMYIHMYSLFIALPIGLPWTCVLHRCCEAHVCLPWRCAFCTLGFPMSKAYFSAKTRVLHSLAESSELMYRQQVSGLVLADLLYLYIYIYIYIHRHNIGIRPIPAIVVPAMTTLGLFDFLDVPPPLAANISSHRHMLRNAHFGCCRSLLRLSRAT